MCRADAARACAFANSVYNRRSSAANFTLMMGMVMLSIWHVWPELSTNREEAGTSVLWRNCHKNF